MSIAATSHPIRLLEAERSLATAIAPGERGVAIAELVVETITVPRGPWEAPRVEPDPGHLGYLAVDGLLCRELDVAGARSVELLGRGDLLRPWQEDAASFSEPTWRVLEELRLAELDRHFGEQLGRWPELAAVLLERGLRRSRSLAVSAAIENMVGVERRLLTLFWHLAERSGLREADGIVIPLRLTHQVLSDLVGARRPSVTTALASLARQGQLERKPTGWLLRGTPPASDQKPTTRSSPA
jgi:CRP/FNR family transcriptional regulator, cyclic AMP receptor protein